MQKNGHPKYHNIPFISILWLPTILLFAALACGGEAAVPAGSVAKVTLPSSSANEDQVGEALPPTTTLAMFTAETKQEIFEDGFELDDVWAEGDTDRYSAGRMEGGVYQISFWQAGDTEYLVSFQPHQFSLPFHNMKIRVWGTALNKAGAYGLACRYADSQNFYTFHISTDERYWLYKRVGGEWTDLDSGSNPAIKEENTIEFECINDHISGSVNGNIISSVNDNSLAEGNAALYAQPLGGDLVGAWSYYAVFDSFEMIVLP